MFGPSLRRIDCPDLRNQVHAFTLIAMILAADLGGTKCNVILFDDTDAQRLRTVYRRQVATAEFSAIEDFLHDFFEKAAQQGYALRDGQLNAAAFGVAGAIVNDEVVCNNLPWHITRQKIAQALSLPPGKVVLLNDVEAAASSLIHLEESDLTVLNPGTPQARGPKVYIAAGTGLGESYLFWDGRSYRVSPCEAGLTDFAPGTDQELQLLARMRREMPRVCTEEIVSGRGFVAIHRHLFPEAQHAFLDDPAIDAAPLITRQAFAKSCPACEETLHIWTQAYGSEAGNMALRGLTFGGVYIGGGIALKILPKLQDGTFVRAFCDKTKLSAELARIPIYLVMNPDAPVLGAAYAALAQAQAT